MSPFDTIVPPADIPPVAMRLTPEMSPDAVTELM
jgi:hypothetical protein